MATLRATQTLLWRLITAPEGVAAAVGDAPEVALGRVVCGDARLSEVERVDVYANMYFFRLLDCLKEDFPALHRVLGAVDFHNLVTGYLLEHPSHHPSLRFLGGAMADFLEDHEFSRQRPFLADLARLEWALLDAFDAPDAKPIDADRLRQIAPEDWGQQRFRYTPSLRVVSARHTVNRVLDAVTAGDAPSAPDEGQTDLVVWRRELRVFHRAIEPTERALLDCLRAGADFAAGCQRVVELVGEDRAAETAAGAVGRWVADGLVVDL